jgi:hypothetical protein
MNRAARGCTALLNTTACAESMRALRLLAPAAADQSRPAYQSFQRVAYNVTVVSMVCFCGALHVSMGTVRYYMCCRERSRSSM